MLTVITGAKMNHEACQNPAGRLPMNLLGESRLPELPAVCVFLKGSPLELDHDEHTEMHQLEHYNLFKSIIKIMH